MRQNCIFCSMERICTPVDRISELTERISFAMDRKASFSKINSKYS